MVLKSPGIAYREVDATAYPATVDSSIVGIVGFADKGPENKAILITTPEQLINTFGEPNENLQGQGLIAALEILEVTNRVYFVRAASGSVEASSKIPLGVCPHVTFTSAYENYFGVATSAPALHLHVILKKNTTDVLNKIFTIPATSSAPFATQLLAFQSVFGDGTAKGDVVGVAQDPFDNSFHIFGTIAGPEYVLEVSAASGLTGAVLNAASGVSCFYTSALEFTSGALSLGPTGSASAVSGFGLKLNPSAAHYLVKSLYGGPGYNLGRSLKTGEVTGLSIEVDNIVGPWFNVYVNDKGYENESFRVGFYGDNTFISEVIKESENDTPLNSDFIKASFEGSSVSAATLTSLDSPAEELDDLFNGAIISSIPVIDSGYGPTSWENSSGLNARFVKLLPGTYSMLGGSNGIAESTDPSASLIATIIGNSAEKKGIYALDDDNLNISMAIVPGLHNAAVQNELITLAETSQNFIAACSPPFGITTAQKAVDWMNGKGTVGDRKAAINSSYVAVYWPHVQIFNTYSEKDVWLDPAIYGVRAMAFTDSTAEPWFAPAGFTRGRLTKPLDTEEILSQGDKDTLYENNINPMVKFFPEGITIFGQKTAKRLPSATDRIGVRRLMIYLRKLLLQSTRAYVFEPNDPITWEAVRTNVEDILRDIASRRGIAESKVICDATVNTPLRVSRREMWCKVILRPVEAAEYIIFEVNLTNNTSSIGA